MANLKYKISVVTVTYGNRWIFLSRVIQRLLNSHLVYQVVLVNNASTYNLQAQVDQLNDTRIKVIEHTENLGSAAGYKAGIAHAHQNTDTDFIWLLDDDNLPEENTLDLLIKTWEELKAVPNKTALYCLRHDRKAHVNIAKGENPYRYYLVPDNFLGFNLFRIPYNQFLKFRDKFKKPSAYLQSAPIPYVPYGGLLMHKALIDVIGYPDERFFLYVDDSEYTYRITQSGGTILLVPGCEVRDIDQSIGNTYQPKPLHSHYLDQWSFRTYYHVRNRLYFYNSVAVKNRMVFSLNKIIYMAWLKLISILSAKQSEYQKLKVAVNDGLNARVGKAGADKF